MLDIATYLNRITSQHKIKPKYMALVAARLQPFIDLAECLESFDAAFDLENAVGKQLDVIGEYVGIKRLLNFQPQFSSALLPDPYYRMLIKAKISLNNWDGTVTGIKKLWGDIFPNYTVTVVDNQDMTLNVQITGLRSLFESELIKHGYITPKPMGVLVDYYVLFSILLDTTLYLGSFIHDRFLGKDLPAPAPPANNSKPLGEVYIGGMRLSGTLRFVIPSAST